MDNKHNVTGMTVPSRPQTRDRLWLDAEDKNQKGVIVYYKAADSKLYYQYDGTTYSGEVPTTDYERLFVGGVIKYTGSAYVMPIKYTPASGDDAAAILWADDSTVINAT